MGQAWSFMKFYRHGKSHFTATGWEAVQSSYKPGALDVDMSNKVCIVTGANSGIGKELTSFLASKNANIYMMCRNQERGEQARQEIAEETGNQNLKLLIGDCSLKADIERVVAEFKEKEKSLHCLVCNAGALLNTKTTTKEGFEVTFAAHLLFGTYHLSRLLLPVMDSTPESRLVIVTSGGMYNTKFPSWDTAIGNNSYDGQLAYAYAKRGQVLLAEHWAARYPNVPTMTVHPGWVATPGVDAAYGSSQSWLQPLRSLWQGTEGIAWLCAVERQELQSGALYLDRTVQDKHLVNSSINTEEEVDYMLASLKVAADSCNPDARVENQGAVEETKAVE